MAHGRSPDPRRHAGPAYCATDFGVGTRRVTRIAERSISAATRGATSFSQYSLSYTSFVQALALGFGVEAPHPDVGGVVLLTPPAPGDHHAPGDLERDDVLLHEPHPLVHAARMDLVLSKLVEHRITPMV